MLRAVPDWKLVQLVNSSFTSFGPKAMRGRSKFSTEATLMNDKLKVTMMIVMMIVVMMLLI